MSFELLFSAAARQWRVFKVLGRSAVISSVPFFRVPVFQKFTACKKIVYEACIIHVKDSVNHLKIYAL
jgi:hypothetical protein